MRRYELLPDLFHAMLPAERQHGGPQSKQSERIGFALPLFFSCVLFELGFGTESILRPNEAI